MTNALEIETYKILFDKSPEPTLYVVSKKVALANRAAAELFKRLGLDDPGGADFGKLWPKGTKASGKPGLTELKALRRGEYGIKLPDNTMLAVEITPFSRKKPTRTVVTLEDVTERKRTEEKLKESEVQYRSTVDSMSDAVHIVDSDLNIVLLNSVFTEWNERLNLETDVIGKNVFDVFPFLPDKVRDEYRHVFLTGENLITEEETEVDGEVFITETRKIPIFEDGDVARVVTIVRDITEKNVAEEALRTSEEKYRTLFEDAGTPITYMNLDGTFLLMNPVSAAVLGGTPDDFLGKSVFEVLPGIADTMMERIGQVVDSKAGGAFEDLVELPSGEHWFHSNFQPVIDPSGTVFAVQIVSHDITERVMAEEALREKRSQIKTVLEAMPDLLILMDGEFVYQVVNPAFCQFVGKTEEELVGKTDFDVFPPDEAEIYRQSDIEVMTSGEPQMLERQVTDADGVERSIQVAKTPILDTTGESTGILVSVRDITERKWAEEALKESEVQYRSTVDSMSDAVHVVDSDLNIVLFNSVFMEWNERLNLDVDVIAKNVFDVFPFLPGRVRDEYRHVFLTGENLITEEETEVDGEVFITETRKVPIFENGDVARVVTIVRDITDRRLMERALRESEEKYRNLIERSNDGVAIVQDGVIRFANERVTEVFGYPVEEIIGKDFIDYIHPDEVAKLTDIYKGRISGKEIPSVYETVVINREGESIYVEINAGLIQYEGKPADFAFVRDITERKVAEEALRESEEKYRTLFDNAGTPITYVNLDGTFLLMNPVSATALGGTPDDFLGKSIFEVKPDVADVLMDRVSRVVDSGAGDAFEHMIELPSGDRWFYSNFQPVKDAGGKVVAVQIVSQDITERKRAEKALRESEEKYRTLFDKAGTPITYVDLDGTFLLMNPVSATALGGTPDDFLGKSIFEVNPDVADVLMDRVSRVVDSGAGDAFEHMIELPSGDRWFYSNFQPVIDAGGKVVAVQVVSQDITERKRAEEALRESEEVFRVTFENAKDAILWAQPETGLIVNCNKSAEALLEMEKDEIIGMHQSKLHPPEKTEYYTELFKQHMGREGAVDDEAEIITKSGQIKAVHISASLINVAGRRIMHGSFRDITQIKKVQLERAVVADVNQVLAASLDTSTTISEVFNVLNRLFDFDRMSIAVLSDDGETFRVFEAIEKGKAPPKTYEAGTVIPAVGTRLNECASTRDVLVVEDLGTSEFAESKKLYKAGIRAVILLPLIIGEKVLGTWNIGSKRRGAFKGISLETLEELSSDLALWLEARLTYEKVASSEEQYRTLQTNVPVGVFRTSAEPGGRLISLNPALARMFGYETTEDMNDISVSDLYLNPKDRERFVETVLSAGAITDYEVEFKRADGKSFWGSLSARAIEDADGEVVYFDGILEDITERKEAELALAESEKKYKALYETTRVLSVYADIDEVFGSIGEQAAILFGSYDCAIYTIEREAGVLKPRFSDSKTFRDEILSFEIPIGVGIVGHVAETGEGIVVNYDDKDLGVTIPGTEGEEEEGESAVAVPLKVKDQVAGVIVLTRIGEKFYPDDLDALYAFSAQAAVAVERAGLLEKIRDSEEKYRTTFESTGTAIVLIEEDTTISFANKGFAILSGCPREEVENNKSWTEFVAPYELERMRGYHDERRRLNGEAPSEYEFDFLRPDGSIRRVFLSVAMVPGTKQSVASLIDITELRRAEERYRTTVESTGTAMALLEEDGLVTFVNKEMERLAGVPREELENKVHWLDFVDAEDVRELRRHESELRQGREIPPQVGFRFVRPRGGTRFCLLNAALLPGTTMLVVSVLDITDRKQAEEAVERERRAFAVVAEAAAQGKDIRDMCERVLTGLNDALGFDIGSVRLYNAEEKRLDKTAIVGITEDEGTLASPQLDDKYFLGALIARTRKEIFAPDVAAHEISKTHKKRIDELGIKGLVGYPLLSADGLLIGAMVLGTRDVMNLGKAENETIRTVVEMLTVAIERRLADEAVAESEEKYRALFEQAGDAVYLETLDGKILEVNEQACGMLGYTRDELLEMTVGDLTPREIQEALPGVTKELSERGAVQMEGVNVRKDGGLVPVDLNARLINVGGRRLVFAIVRDISVHKDMVQGLKKQADELLDLKRAKDTLTDLVVHDIKNISSSMLVWLELLQDGVFGPMSNEQDETIARVIDNNMQLFDLSQELLDVARSEEGEIQLRKHPFLLDKSVTELAEYYLPTAEKQSKTLDLDIKDEPILVYADEERLRRVVSNLVTNALKFVEPNEGEVRVSVDKDEENSTAVVRVADNGRGIPEEFQEMIFEKFRQVELRDAGFKRGAGLGLTFCKMVVSEHGGKMWVESDGERGSTFIFTVPLYRR